MDYFELNVDIVDHPRQDLDLKFLTLHQHLKNFDLQDYKIEKFFQVLAQKLHLGKNSNNIIYNSQ